VEDMTAEEKAEKGALIPAGLINLRKFVRNIKLFSIGIVYLCVLRKHVLHECHCSVFSTHARSPRRPE
jgi:hypothetical protein